ncbi:E3 ubiquitin-protein ligase listerin isoform X2 [Leptidea sinapis]|nr:E3 ubiquitin-protein ligase listerin isoform X2 [Leptidea sinapis]XP_050681516.1 E3 ubiquitin-protein ligase listerin isoform X2 [Leptidea sinapis]XP_050681517.1 E3 ubiquitin-protein ligase listerin isoform X2 [Leptidea sinapis]XP_050681518.1 E3 ubiquitin-protein ligase listerin isoform X2 [Leptidea sinapis]XP_050681519.1 E3 ubiquitin-protein ligase listerin isoform X2 [Leptidea sinapis]XP_050681521.1 E3 ubiquitin-protein ligase listerin isoform X2 [Leptidea sinapis]
MVQQHLSQELVSDAISAAQQFLLERLHALDVPRIEWIVALCPFLTKPDADTGDIISFTQKLFDMNVDESELMTQSQALLRDCLFGHFNCLFDDIPSFTVLKQLSTKNPVEFTKISIMPYIYKAAFRALYLRSLLRGGDDVAPRDWLAEEYFKMELVNVCHDSAIIPSLHDGYFFLCWDVIEEAKQLINDVLRDIISIMPVEHQKSVLDILTQKSHHIGYYWARAKILFELKLNPGQSVNAPGAAPPAERDAELEPELNNLVLDDIIRSNGFFHSLQERECQGPESALRKRYLVLVRSWYVHARGGAEGGAERARGLASRAAAALATADPDPLIDDFYEHDQNMFTDREFSAVRWETATCAAELLRYVSELIVRRGWSCAPHVWDFINLTLCATLGSLLRTPRCTRNLQWAAVCSAALRAADAVNTFVCLVPARSERQRPEAHVAALPAEWRDVFEPEITAHALHLASSICEESSRRTTATVCEMAVIQPLIGLLEKSLGGGLRWERVPAARRSGDLAPRTLARAALAVLRGSAHHACKYLAYHLLRASAEPLVLEDAEKVMLWSQRREEEGEDDSEEKSNIPEGGVDLSLTLYYETIENTVSSLCGAEEAESTGPADVNRAAGFAVAALALLRHASLARGDLVHHYSESLGESGMVAHIIRASLALLPPELLAHAADERLPAPAHLLPAFTSDPLLLAPEPEAGETASRAACRLLYEVLRLCGGTARGVWSALDGRRAALLRRLVLTCVATPLAHAQLTHLKEHAHELEDAEITISWSRGSASCLAAVDTCHMELNITLGTCHPLEVPEVTAPAPALRLASLHHVKLYLAFQNGWLVNAFKMWTELIRGKVNRAKECAVCCHRLHPATGLLPSSHCRSCNKHFHPRCLGKWFKSVGKSNCPLCRKKF